jgi:2-methylcitrate dehydratase PrpD
MRNPCPIIDHVLDFALHARLSDMPAHIVELARERLLDTVGVMVAGTQLPIADIVRRFAVRHLSGPSGSRLLLDGRIASAPGAAFAAAAITDGYDAHDGHVLCKGHVGAAVIPTALALAEQAPSTDAEEFLAWIVLGYEIGTRAGIALHGSSPVFHSSGAWNALAAAAIGVRALGLSHGQGRHALGIAEYYGPRSPLMRVVEHPTMLKDGTAMGAFAGISAAYLAAEGFTGAPAETIAGQEADKAGALWGDLGQKWRIAEQYVKPVPVCRWTQPAARAVEQLRGQHPELQPHAIRQVEVRSFHEAVSLSCREPAETDAAQYSLPFVVAAMLVHGRLSPDEIAGNGLKDPVVLDLCREMRLVEMPAYNALFPAERWADVRITLTDGRIIESGPVTTVGDPSSPLSPTELKAKFFSNAASGLGDDMAGELLHLLGKMPDGPLAPILNILLEPPNLRTHRRSC